MINEYHLKDWYSTYVSEMIYGFCFYLYKMGNKLKFYIQGEFEYEFKVGTYVSVTRLVLMF